MSAGVRPGYARDKEALRARLGRIEGQVRGIRRMIDEDRYCVDVVTQVSAVKAALDSVALQLLEDHVEHCVSDAIRSGGGEDRVRELTETIGRFVRG